MSQSALCNSVDYAPIGGGNSTLSTKRRVDYIDLLKGITILWIIWIHTDHPEFGGYRNPIFFFASGIFFKLTDFNSFFSKRIKTIIIPFLFFYILSIPFNIFLDFWHYRSIAAFDWTRVLDVFRIVDRGDYLTLNLPLWFLLTLFVIQLISLILLRLPKVAILFLAIASIFFKEELDHWATPFMINKACYWFSYFAIGYLTGKPLIKLLNGKKRQILVLVISVLIVLLCIALEESKMSDYHGFVEHIKYIAFIFAFTSVFSFFDGMDKVEILRFFGKNSLIVLGAHRWVLVPIERIVFKYIGIHHPAIGFCMAIATAIILIPIIIILNKKVPYFVGK